MTAALALPRLVSRVRYRRQLTAHLPHILFTKGAGVAINTGKGKRVGIVKDRYQKQNSRTGLWDKYDKQGNYVGTKKTGGPFKSIIRLIGRNPRRR
jgi:hypothetical protein